MNLIEVAVVVFILGLILAIAVPAYTAAQRDAHRKACEANMNALFQAEEAYRVRNRAYTTSLSADLGPAMGGMPTCPSGSAAYTAATGGTGAAMTVTIRCNNTGAHITGQKLATSNGVTFTGVAP